MNLFLLARRQLLARPLHSALNLLLLALGIATISLLLLFSRQLEDKLLHTAAGIDLVVGAKGSPLQLILSSVYHADIPTGNIAKAHGLNLLQAGLVALQIIIGQVFGPNAAKTFNDWFTTLQRVGELIVTNAPKWFAWLTTNLPGWIEKAATKFQEWTDSIEGEGPKDDAGRIAFAFRLCFSREPNTNETARVQAYLDAKRKADSKTAWANVARVLMNLDEFITRE